ncbi:unnamed protein product [Amoebophrya sp. A120]|nr:unnamed protein product [Amoebophrya sp. A120]|eukprot:GSA120T00007482001.1
MGEYSQLCAHFLLGIHDEDEKERDAVVDFWALPGSDMDARRPSAAGFSKRSTGSKSSKERLNKKSPEQEERRRRLEAFFTEESKLWVALALTKELDKRFPKYQEKNKNKSEAFFFNIKNSGTSHYSAKQVAVLSPEVSDGIREIIQNCKDDSGKRKKKIEESLQHFTGRGSDTNTKSRSSHTNEAILIANKHERVEPVYQELLERYNSDDYNPTKEEEARLSRALHANKLLSKDLHGKANDLMARYTTDIAWMKPNGGADKWKVIQEEAFHAGIFAKLELQEVPEQFKSACVDEKLDLDDGIKGKSSSCCIAKCIDLLARVEEVYNKLLKKLVKNYAKIQPAMGEFRRKLNQYVKQQKLEQSEKLRANVERFKTTINNWIQRESNYFNDVNALMELAAEECPEAVIPRVEDLDHAHQQNPSTQNSSFSALGVVPGDQSTKSSIASSIVSDLNSRVVEPWSREEDPLLVTYAYGGSRIFTTDASAGSSSSATSSSSIKYFPPQPERRHLPGNKGSCSVWLLGKALKDITTKGRDVEIYRCGGDEEVGIGGIMSGGGGTSTPATSSSNQQQQAQHLSLPVANRTWEAQWAFSKFFSDVVLQKLLEDNGSTSTMISNDKNFSASSHDMQFDQKLDFWLCRDEQNRKELRQLSDVINELRASLFSEASFKLMNWSEPNPIRPALKKHPTITAPGDREKDRKLEAAKPQKSLDQLHQEILKEVFSENLRHLYPKKNKNSTADRSSLGENLSLWLFFQLAERCRVLQTLFKYFYSNLQPEEQERFATLPQRGKKDIVEREFTLNEEELRKCVTEYLAEAAGNIYKSSGLNNMNQQYNRVPQVLLRTADELDEKYGLDHIVATNLASCIAKPQNATALSTAKVCITMPRDRLESFSKKFVSRREELLKRVQKEWQIRLKVALQDYERLMAMSGAEQHPSEGTSSSGSPEQLSAKQIGEIVHNIQPVAMCKIMYRLYHSPHNEGARAIFWYEQKMDFHRTTSGTVKFDNCLTGDEANEANQKILREFFSNRRFAVKKYHFYSFEFEKALKIEFSRLALKMNQVSSGTLDAEVTLLKGKVLELAKELHDLNPKKRLRSLFTREELEKKEKALNSGGFEQLLSALDAEIVHTKIAKEKTNKDRGTSSSARRFELQQPIRKSSFIDAASPQAGPRGRSTSSHFLLQNNVLNSSQENLTSTCYAGGHNKPFAPLFSPVRESSSSSSSTSDSDDSVDSPERFGKLWAEICSLKKTSTTNNITPATGGVVTSKNRAVVAASTKIMNRAAAASNVQTAVQPQHGLNKQAIVAKAKQRAPSASPRAGGATPRPQQGAVVNGFTTALSSAAAGPNNNYKRPHSSSPSGARPETKLAKPAGAGPQRVDATPRGCTNMQPSINFAVPMASPRGALTKRQEEIEQQKQRLEMIEQQKLQNQQQQKAQQMNRRPVVPAGGTFQPPMRGRSPAPASSRAAQQQITQPSPTAGIIVLEDTPTPAKANLGNNVRNGINPLSPSAIGEPHPEPESGSDLEEEINPPGAGAQQAVPGASRKNIQPQKLNYDHAAKNKGKVVAAPTSVAASSSQQQTKGAPRPSVVPAAHAQSSSVVVGTSSSSSSSSVAAARNIQPPGAVAAAAQQERKKVQVVPNLAINAPTVATTTSDGSTPKELLVHEYGVVQSQQKEQQQLQQTRILPKQPTPRAAATTTTPIQSHNQQNISSQHRASVTPGGSFVMKSMSPRWTAIASNVEDFRSRIRELHKTLPAEQIDWFCQTIAEYHPLLKPRHEKLDLPAAVELLNEFSYHARHCYQHYNTYTWISFLEDPSRNGNPRASTSNSDDSGGDARGKFVKPPPRLFNLEKEQTKIKGKRECEALWDRWDRFTLLLCLIEMVIEILSTVLPKEAYHYALAKIQVWCLEMAGNSNSKNDKLLATMRKRMKTLLPGGDVSVYSGGSDDYHELHAWMVFARFYVQANMDELEPKAPGDIDSLYLQFRELRRQGLTEAALASLKHHDPDHEQLRHRNLHTEESRHFLVSNLLLNPEYGLIKGRVNRQRAESATVAAFQGEHAVRPSDENKIVEDSSSCGEQGEFFTEHQIAELTNFLCNLHERLIRAQEKRARRSDTYQRTAIGLITMGMKIGQPPAMVSPNYISSAAAGSDGLLGQQQNNSSRRAGGPGFATSSSSSALPHGPSGVPVLSLANNNPGSSPVSRQQLEAVRQQQLANVSPAVVHGQYDKRFGISPGEQAVLREQIPAPGIKPPKMKNANAAKPNHPKAKAAASRRASTASVAAGAPVSSRRGSKETLKQKMERQYRDELYGIENDSDEWLPPKNQRKPSKQPKAAASKAANKAGLLPAAKHGAAARRPSTAVGGPNTRTNQQQAAPQQLDASVLDGDELYQEEESSSYGFVTSRKRVLYHESPFKENIQQPDAFHIAATDEENFVINGAQQQQQNPASARSAAGLVPSKTKSGGAAAAGGSSSSSGGTGPNTFSSVSSNQLQAASKNRLPRASVQPQQNDLGNHNQRGRPSAAGGGGQQPLIRGPKASRVAAHNGPPVTTSVLPGAGTTGNNIKPASTPRSHNQTRNKRSTAAARNNNKDANCVTDEEVANLPPLILPDVNRIQYPQQQYPQVFDNHGNPVHSPEAPHYVAAPNRRGARQSRASFQPQSTHSIIGGQHQQPGMLLSGGANYPVPQHVQAQLRAPTPRGNNPSTNFMMQQNNLRQRQHVSSPKLKRQRVESEDSTAEYRLFENNQQFVDFDKGTEVDQHLHAAGQGQPQAQTQQDNRHPRSLSQQSQSEQSEPVWDPDLMGNKSLLELKPRSKETNDGDNDEDSSMIKVTQVAFKQPRTARGGEQNHAAVQNLQQQSASSSSRNTGYFSNQTHLPGATRNGTMQGGSRAGGATPRVGGTRPGGSGFTMNSNHHHRADEQEINRQMMFQQQQQVQQQTMAQQSNQIKRPGRNAFGANARSGIYAKNKSKINIFG